MGGRTSEVVGSREKAQWMECGGKRRPLCVCVCVCDKGCMVEREGVVKDRDRRGEPSRGGRECGVWETVRPRRMPYVSGGRVVEQQPWSLSWWMGWFWEATNTVGYLCVWRCETNRSTWRKRRTVAYEGREKKKREERESEREETRLTTMQKPTLLYPIGNARTNTRLNAREASKP